MQIQQKKEEDLNLHFNLNIMLQGYIRYNLYCYININTIINLIINHINCLVLNAL